MATHSSILAWKIPWIEEPGRLQSRESQRVGQMSTQEHHEPWWTLAELNICFFQDTTTWVTVSVRVAQLCPTLCDPMDYTVHGILQARILE